MTVNTIIEKAKQALGITALNPMQNKVIACWTETHDDLIVYSPTGTGKTLATAIPALLVLNDQAQAPQVLIIAPSRELAVQTHGVLKKLSPLTQSTCCYGGHNSGDERLSLASKPMIVVGTPGRLLDHINNNHIDTAGVDTIILDELDKTLELGFSDEMRAIMNHCPTTARKILTSATMIDTLPNYVKLNNCCTINYLKSSALMTDDRITLWNVKAKDNDRLTCLLQLLYSIPDERTIVFANTRESAEQAYKFLTARKMSTALYHGALEQIEREKAVAMFNNGTAIVLVATDLAARGLDIANVRHIVHYELPLTHEILIHRNGRTARVDATGDAYLITTPNEPLPHFVEQCRIFNHHSPENNKISHITTIHISAGKKEKVSRGDIVGFLATHASNLEANEIGTITIHDHYSLVAVPASKAKETINSASPFKLKKLKVKLSIAKPILRFARS